MSVYLEWNNDLLVHLMRSLKQFEPLDIQY